MLQTLCRFTLPPAIVLVALALYRLVIGPAEPLAPRIVAKDDEPALIAPKYDEPRVATDEQLAQVLDRVKPPTDPINTNHMVHALRLWGPKADFADPRVPSGKEMRDYFLRDEVFQKWAGKETPALFYLGKGGLEARTFDDGGKFRTTSSFHQDDLLATLAETLTPLDTKMQLRSGEATVADLLDNSLRRFYLDRHEYEWSIIVYARYLYPVREWRNKFGERIELAGLINELMDKPPETGPCDGLHRLEAMVVLYRVDEALRERGEKSPLKEPARLRMLRYMQKVSELLVASQSPEGFWAREWSLGKPPVESKDKKISLHDKLLVTGHQLEWLALAPEQVQPPRENIVRAGQWLTRTLVEMDAKELADAYGPYSHAARALCLWRSAEPIDAWRRGQPTTETSQSEISNSKSQISNLRSEIE